MAQNRKREDLYYKELDYWQGGNLIEARKFFEQTYNEPEHRQDSLLKLTRIDLIEGKYANARKRLENEDEQTTQIKKMYGLLENMENNFEASRDYYLEYGYECKEKNLALMLLAKIYLQLGENELARKIFEYLQAQEYRVEATINLICLNILEREYKEAEKLLKSIDREKLSNVLRGDCNVLDACIKYFSGKSKNSGCGQGYTVDRLFDSSNDLLLKHVKKHTKENHKKDFGYFFEELDFKRLILDAEDRIEGMNANHFEKSDMYRLKLDYCIGFIGDKVTSDLCVVTVIGTKKIVTMYPVSLSDEFDREGFSKSKQLMIKRGYGGI